MLTPEEKRIIKKQIEINEGRVPHMYLDSEGYVTVGVGHLLANTKAALRVPFFDNKTNKKATVDAIRKEYDSIKKLSPNHSAAYYKKHANLYVTDAEMDRMTGHHLATFESELKRLYPKFDNFPSEVRLALLDMIFNLGMTKLRRIYVKFSKAINAQNWQLAADESKRRQVGEKRNNYVKGLLEKAAKKTQNQQTVETVK